MLRPAGQVGRARGAHAALLLAMALASVPAVAARELQLDPNSLFRLALEQNAELVFARLQNEIAGYGVQAQAALYEPSLYGSLRHEDRVRQRSVEELLTTSALSPVLSEKVDTLESGLKWRIPSGAEGSLSVRVSARRNNIIGSARQDGNDSESNGALVLTLRQPLLRGVGRSIVETDLRLAQDDRDITLWQYRQQLIRVGADALAAYWQLQRAIEGRSVRTEGLQYARELARDVQLKVDGGRLPPNALLEARGAELEREVELSRALQLVAESESRLRALLLLPAQGVELKLPALAEPTGAEPANYDAERSLAQALDSWPGYRVAQLRLRQSQQRLEFARDQLRPALDLQFSYSNTSLARQPDEAFRNLHPSNYRDAYLGLTLEMPLGGNQKARAQYSAQAERVRQAELEVRSVLNALDNDIRARAGQYRSARLELAHLQAEFALRQRVLQSERQQYQLGMSALGQLLRRESEMLEARLRLAEGQVRLEVGRAALMATDGSLLREYGVEVGY